MQQEVLCYPRLTLVNVEGIFSTLIIIENPCKVADFPHIYPKKGILSFSERSEDKTGQRRFLAPP